MFFLLPVGVDYRARRYPVVTFTLMGICVAIYLITLSYQLQNSRQTWEWVSENLWLIPSESHWWTYLTSMFVHAGFFHVAGNMVYLFLFGSCVEDLIGRTRYIAFYLLCGLAAQFAYIAMIPDHFASEIPMGGASGAISGCIGGFLLLLAKRKIEFKWIFFFWFRIWAGEFFLPAWLVISCWFLKDLANAVLAASADQYRGGVAFGAHVGGTICGVALIGLEKLRRRGRPFLEEQDEAEEAEETGTPAVRPGAKRVVARIRPAPTPAELPTVYLHINGSQAGPFTLTQIRQMFETSAISADALYWQQGMEDWRSAEELRAPGLA